jgi:uncharacterized membrane protein
MSEESLHLLALISAVGCGLVGGIFFAFSTFVMKALDRLSPAQAIAAMQSINVTVINPLFMAAFLGTGAACAVVTIFSLLSWHSPGRGFLLVGSLLYLFGTILVTIAFNVPRNEALAAVDAESAEGAQLWASYVPSWTAWNHVRTVAALAAASALLLAFRP